MLESAIPEYLRRERTCPASTPPNYVPPFPAYCARFPTILKDPVLAVIGAQHTSTPLNGCADLSIVKEFIESASGAIQPGSWEFASVTDKRDALNTAILAYWPSAEKHQAWETESGFATWWQSPARENDNHGWFQEIFRPAMDCLETVFSNNENPEGVASMQENVSGELEEHAYWGSMRDRLAAAQNDSLKGIRWRTDQRDNSLNGADGKRIRVPGKKNLCVIRSGQDWSDTLPDERRLYLETMHPVLVKGMEFLRDEGREVGCYTMNLWDVVDPNTHAANRERTFGLGFFDDLASLEYWSKSHKTHINIFGGFLKYAKKLNNVLSLRLFHEVYVLEEDQQFFEYIGCHEDTGMLASLQSREARQKREI
ncbi:hypothetical protein ACN47E_002652 [Coniothyrium glycines]